MVSSLFGSSMSYASGFTVISFVVHLGNVLLYHLFYKIDSKAAKWTRMYPPPAFTINDNL
jgi:hypothetical protein